MTEGKTSEDVLTGDSDTSPAASRKWHETPAGRAAAAMVSVGFLGIVVAAMLLLTQRAHNAENVTEATDSAPPTVTVTETATATVTRSAPTSAPTTRATTTAPPAPPPTRPPAAPGSPRFTPAPAAPAAPATVPTTPAPPPPEEAEPEMPELNVTRGPIEMSPPRGDPPEEE